MPEASPIKDLIVLILLIVIIFAFLFYVINIFSYFDPLHLCYISIQGDVLQGNKETIQKAIHLIKENDKANYIMLCKYVDVISEKNCRIADVVVDPQKLREGWELPGCYIKGSKTIYLYPNSSGDDKVIQDRAEVIKKYTSVSKSFWEGLK